MECRHILKIYMYRESIAFKLLIINYSLNPFFQLNFSEDLNLFVYIYFFLTKKIIDIGLHAH